MKRRISTVMAVIMASALTLTACGSSGSGSPTTSGEKKTDDGGVAMVLSGLKTDEGFNQYTYEGMVQAGKELGIRTAFREEVSQDEQLEVIRQFAQSKYNIIIGQGGQFGEALQTVAKEFPDTKFIFSVGTETGDLPNLTAATVSYRHAGYLGGIMAAHSTKTKKVSMITGEWYGPQRQMEEGFRAGVASVDSSIEVSAITTGSWSDVNTAREASLSLIAKGNDILFPCLDAAYVGVLSSAQDSENIYVVGSVADMGKVAPEVTIGSVVFNWKALGYEEAAGKLLDGKVHVLGMESDGITPVYDEKLLSADGQAALKKAIDGLKDGSLGIEP